MTALKQIKNLDRINFLKKFTTEILMNIVKEQRIEQRIHIAKLKQKFIEKKQAEQNFEEILKSPIFESSEELEKRRRLQEERTNQLKKLQEEKKAQKLQETTSKQNSLIEKLRKPLFHRAKQPVPMTTLQMRKSVSSQQLQPQLQNPHQQMQRSLEQVKEKYKSRPPEKDIRKVIPEAEPRPEGFALGKIEQLLRDKSIQLIECPGPGKKVLVKRLNKINTTAISLSQQEITTIIQSFSQQAKIPIMGGILKAAVGDLIISAVISDYVGSRFIINKITPYSQLMIR